jgi:outer membrane murein-binding lipoprotein Lpp
MKITIRVIVALALLFTLALSACSTVKMTYAKPQLQQAQTDAQSAEAQVAQLKTDRDTLSKQVAAKDAELKKLQDYQKQLQAQQGGK